MSGPDPHGPWTVAMRRRIMIQSAFLLPLPILGIASFVCLWFLVAAESRSAGADWLSHFFWPILVVAGMVLVLLLLPLLGLRRILAERQLVRLVPAHDGRVCPKCRTPLPATPSAGACSRCRRPYDHEQLRAYWEQYPRGPLFSPPVIEPPAPDGRWARFRKTLQERPLAAIAWTAGVFFVAFMALALCLPGTFVGNAIREAIQFAPMFLLCLGLLSYSWYRRRVGDTLHCAKCDYQQAPQGERSLQCHECGAYWIFRGGTVRGRPIGRPWMLWLAIALWAGAALSLVGPRIPAFRGAFRGLQAWPLDLLPNSMLIREVTWPSLGFDDDEWAAVNKRKLSSQDERTLASGLLDKRRRKRFFSIGDETWFVARLKAGTLPDEIVARYYREMLRIWIDSPPTAKVGESFDVSLGSEDHTNLHSPATGAGKELVYFAGFYVAGATEALARQEQDTCANLLNRPEFKPSARVTADRPGPLRIRAVAWLVIVPWSGAGGPIRWQPDGTPIIPMGAERSERLEVERVVQIEK